MIYTPEEEAVIRRLYRYADAQKFNDPSFVKMAAHYGKEILSRKNDMRPPYKEAFDVICKSEREQINLDEMERRLEQC